MKDEHFKRTLIICGGIFAFLSLVFVVWGITHITNGKAYYYRVDASEMGYSVNLYENNFYEEPTLEMDKQYVTNLVKNIDVSLPFKLEGSALTNIKYDYRITGNIVAKERKTSSDATNKVIWDRPYVLSDTKGEELEDVTGFSISPTLMIDFPRYVAIVNEYKNQNHVSIDAALNIKMNVHYTIATAVGDIDENKDFEMVIPLTATTFAIDFEKNVDNSQMGGGKVVEWRFIICGIACILIALIIFGVLFFCFYFEPRRRYDVKLNKILRDYTEIIAEVSEPIKLKGERVFELSDFDDLVDIEAEVKSPILFYEISAGKHPESEFVVFKDDKAFRYILKG